MDSDERCAFCEAAVPLRESHVLPAFAYRWLKGRSGTGHIRHTENPNRRVQDGLKLKWLCDDCEGRFSRFETAFATKVFHPWHSGTQSIKYDDWLLKFCVSVSWRVLKFARAHGRKPEYTPERHALLGRAESRWRAFLNGAEPHPGEFEQHLLIFDIVESTTIQDLPHNFNRFMTGAITLDIIGSDRSLMTFAKMGRFMIFGIIQKGPGKWEGTKIHVKQGVLKPGSFVIPAGLLPLFREKAEHVARSMERLSSTQSRKIGEHVLNNLDRFQNSDHFRSIVADIEMFGEQAILKRDPE